MKPPEGIEDFKGIWLVEGDTHIGAWVKEHGGLNIDPHLFRWLRQHFTTRGIDVVWDIGANIGDHTRFYLDLGADVVAFEPNPMAFACLVHNCPEAVCYNVAASDADGSLNLAISENVGASRIADYGGWSVPAVALDDMPGLPAPDFVKIDCEGWEPNVITGMAGTITRYLPLLFVEMNRGALEANGFTVEGLRDQIESLGYHAAAIYPPQAKWDDAQFDCLYTPTP